MFKYMYVLLIIRRMYVLDLRSSHKSLTIYGIFMETDFLYFVVLMFEEKQIALAEVLVICIEAYNFFFMALCWCILW